MPVQVSTQMTITGPEGAALMTRMALVPSLQRGTFLLADTPHLFGRWREIGDLFRRAPVTEASRLFRQPDLAAGATGDDALRPAGFPFDVLRRLDENQTE